MKIALLYPPPWKIPEQGQPLPVSGDGPPEGFRPTDLDGDFFQIPYGLLTLAATMRQHGHAVKVLNLSAFSWNQVEQTLSALQADVYGLSCFTANRRGVALTAQAIKRWHPHAHLTVGGPHATALPESMLAYVPEIDTIVIGEGELTFAELLLRLQHNTALEGLAGIAHRSHHRITVEPRRERIKNLDSLPCPHSLFKPHIFMTSRGCPGQCTFCAKNTTWGRIYRTHSDTYVLDSLEAALESLPVKMLLIKDDTFTIDRKRVLRICEGIRKRNLRFLWSCDTRADVLDEDVLRAMRLAGCERLSLGVESGSPTILRNIRKKIKPEQVLQATRLAKKVGLQVRYFMMLGNRGETAATFQQSLAFVQSAAPHQALFACLSIYPGTDDYGDLQRGGWIDPDVYFTEDFQELKTPFDANEHDTRLMSQWFEANRGIRTLFEPSVEDCQAVLNRLGDHHAAHIALAIALFRKGALDSARAHVHHALSLDYPTPGIAYNTLACIEASDDNLQAMQTWLDRACREDPWHPVLVRNSEIVAKWRASAQTTKPALIASHDFALLERPTQPCLPGPLAANFATWTDEDGPIQPSGPSG